LDKAQTRCVCCRVAAHLVRSVLLFAGVLVCDVIDMPYL
jgi:hypothetical protein